MVRLATNEYKTPNKDNLKDTFMHLTNYAINKENPKFIFNSELENSNLGHKRNLKFFLKVNFMILNNGIIIVF